MSRRIVLVGNAPMRRSVAADVDAADHVVRFNKARGFGAGAGSRTDELYLVNHGGQMAEWLAGGDLAWQPAVAVTGTVVLPVPMLPGHLSARQARERDEPVDPDRVNHLDDARLVLESAGRQVDHVDVDTYRGAQRALGEPPVPAGEHFPSTGFIAAFRTLAGAADDACVELHGFTFEGWHGHSWDGERRWVAARAAEGRLQVHPVR